MGTGQLDQECRKAYIEDAERSLDLGSEWNIGSPE